jgi:hypothetical protein
MNGQAASIVELATKACLAYVRPDLSNRVEAIRQRLTDPSVRVLVVGEFKQGKSSLVNALLNAPVCPVDDDVATSVATLIHHSDEPTARIRRRGTTDAASETEAIDFAELPIYASELGNPANRRELQAVEVGLPRWLLKEGLTLVDTPGVGGLGSAHTAATIAALPLADAVLFVSDASQELTAPEVDFLDTSRESSPEVAFVLTKTDLYPDWRRIAELDEGHLRAGGHGTPMFPTSAALRLKAIESDDRELNQESGYPQVIEFLQGIAAAGNAQGSRAAFADLTSVVGQLEAMFDAEKQALESRERAERLVADFTAAKEKADQLRSQAARWQVTLNDGVADLTADFEHALRARFRETSREAEDTIESEDPGEIWDEFETWLRRRISHDLAKTYIELTTRTQELSIRVAEHFDDGEVPLHVPLDATTAMARAGALDARAKVEADAVGVGTKALTAMRGSYGGLLMFGMVAQLAGMAMINPATAVIGAVMGRKAIKDEKNRQLTIRRQQAKATMRQFIDDATFAIGKDMRDSLRSLQRELRDHYQTRAEELNRSIASALGTAKDAMQASDQERMKRLRDVNAELDRIRQLGSQVAEMSGGGTK